MRSDWQGTFASSVEGKRFFLLFDIHWRWTPQKRTTSKWKSKKSFLLYAMSKHSVPNASHLSKLYCILNSQTNINISNSQTKTNIKLSLSHHCPESSTVYFYTVYWLASSCGAKFKTTFENNGGHASPTDRSVV